ncbi:hypothetical protein Tco_0484209, partial [Tanacetum coccineum]
CDPLALVDCFTLVEDNIGLLEARFEVWAVFVFLKDVMGSVNLTLLTLFIGVTATNCSSELLILGQVRIFQKSQENHQKQASADTRIILERLSLATVSRGDLKTLSLFSGISLENLDGFVLQCDQFVQIDLILKTLLSRF